MGSDIEDVVNLGEFAKRLRVYFSTASMGISFLIYGAIFGGYWLTIFSIGSLYESSWIFIVGALGCIPLAFLCAFLIAKTVPGIKRDRIPHEGVRWVFSFMIPFAAVIIGSLYRVPSSIWYAALGASLLLVHFLVERPLISAGFLKAKPFLAASIPMLLSFPALLSLPPGLDSVAALGLCLLFYSSAGVYALARAARLFSE